MKKKIFFAFVILGLFNACSSDSGNSGSGIDNILVKKISSKTVNYDGTQTNESFEYFYNGNKIYRMLYGPPVGLLTVVTFTYTGDLITNVKEGDYSIVWLEHQYEYNSAGKLIKETSLPYYSSLAEDLKIYTYNSDNTVIRESYHGTTINPGDLYETVRISFDNSNQFVKLETFDGSNWSIKNQITYSTHKSPFRNIVGYDKLYLLTDAKYGFWTYKNYTNTSTYQYSLNAANYPIQRVEKYESANGGTFWTTTNNYTYY